MARAWSRRLPPLMMGVVALALMLAVLPSSLHVPVTGPAGQAEVAPVPGQGQSQANLSDLGLAQSGTVGGGGGEATGDAAVDAGPQTLLEGLHNSLARVPQQARCVGNPPRQTEDPLSPPCVAFWNGDNGGATARGVTRDEIRVVVYDTESGTATGRDFTKPPAATDTPYQRTMKTLLRYFQSRFQTYRRTVHLIQKRATGTDDGSEVNDAKDIAQSAPFAVVITADGTQDFRPFVNTLANDAPSGRIVTLAPIHHAFQSFSRDFIQQHSPYFWSFLPDLESNEAATASMVCRELDGRPAARAGAGLNGTQRSFGILYETASGLQSRFNDVDASVLRAALKQACGIDIPDRHFQATDGTSAQSKTALAQLALDKVTTVILEGTQNADTQAADQLVPPYQPEWLVNSDSTFSQSFFARQQQKDQWAHAYGLTWRWHAPLMSNTYWYRAYEEANPDNDFDTYYGFGIYETLLQLYTAIQRAGPVLTPRTLQAGMESFSRSSPGPDSPSGAYGPGSHAFLDDWLQESWSGTTAPPGGGDPSDTGGTIGCYLELGGGRRFSQSAWPDTDQTGAPGTCSADVENHTNSNGDSAPGSTPGNGA